MKINTPDPQCSAPDSISIEAGMLLKTSNNYWYIVMDARLKTEYVLCGIGHDDCREAFKHNFPKGTTIQEITDASNVYFTDFCRKEDFEINVTTLHPLFR